MATPNTQANADALREQAREIEERAIFVSDEDGGADMEREAMRLRRQAQEIEKRLPSE